MGVFEWVAVGVLLTAGALFVGFPFGVAFGYVWRDRISRARRHLVEQERRRGLSARVIAEETDIPHATINRARRKATESNNPVAKRIGKDGKRRKMPTNPKLNVVTGDVPQEPGPGRTSAEQQLSD
jgi:hypothetical protein